MEVKKLERDYENVKKKLLKQKATITALNEKLGRRKTALKEFQNQIISRNNSHEELREVVQNYVVVKYFKIKYEGEIYEGHINYYDDPARDFAEEISCYHQELPQEVNKFVFRDSNNISDFNAFAQEVWRYKCDKVRIELVSL